MHPKEAERMATLLDPAQTIPIGGLHYLLMPIGLSQNLGFLWYVHDF